MTALFSSTPAKLWDSVASKYQENSYEGSDGLYAANSFRSLLLKEFFATAPKGTVLDAGCGTGEATRMLLADGWDVTSVDYAKNMVEVAGKLTKEANLPGKFSVCSLQELSSLNQKFDYIMLNGVLPYVSKQDEPAVFEQLKKVSAPGATLISAHYNLYFEIFGFDKWSVQALKDEVLSGIGLDESSISLAASKVESLLKSPDAVLDQEKTMKFEDPLAFHDKIANFGFQEFDQAYYNFFYLPPRFEAEQDQSVRQNLEKNFRRTSKGLLLARAFVSFAKLVK